MSLAAALAGVTGPADADAAARSLLADVTWLEPLLSPAIAAVGDPGVQPPFRAVKDGVRTGLILLRTHRIRVALTLTDAAALAAAGPPTRAVLSGEVCWTRYLRSGGARLARWRLSGQLLQPTRGWRLTDGRVLRHDGRTHAQAIVGATGPVVTLSIAVAAGANGIVHEHALPDGRRLRSATHDDAGSRAAMLLSLLRADGRDDARDCFRLASLSPTPMLRWHAMREWLATDFAGAQPSLRAMAADDPEPRVRAAAKTALAMVSAEPCPA